MACARSAASRPCCVDGTKVTVGAWFVHFSDDRASRCGAGRPPPGTHAEANYRWPRGDDAMRFDAGKGSALSAQPAAHRIERRSSQRRLRVARRDAFAAAVSRATPRRCYAFFVLERILPTHHGSARRRGRVLPAPARRSVRRVSPGHRDAERPARLDSAATRLHGDRCRHRYTMGAVVGTGPIGRARIAAEVVPELIEAFSGGRAAGDPGRRAHDRPGRAALNGRARRGVANLHRRCGASTNPRAGRGELAAPASGC